MITADTNLGRLLDEHPELVDVLATYHEHFARLRNRVMRRVMAPRVTVAQAARVAGVPVADLLAAIHRAVGAEVAPVAAAHGTAARGETGADMDTGADALTTRRPAVLDRLTAVEVDVRDDIRRGAEPLARIVAAAKDLGPDEALAVRAPFEPVPLYDVLGQRGFGHWTERLADADWRVWFHRRDVVVQPAPRPAAAATGAWTGDLETIDVRGLEPPLPMVRVLERLDRLPPGGALRVLHERRPMFLYPQLDDRGFVHGTDELAPGLVQIVIRRPEA